MKRYLLVLISILILSFAACDKDEDATPEFDLTEFWNEHHKVEWDSLSTAQNLLGTWDWVYIWCCPEASDMNGSVTTDQGMQVNFRPNDLQVLHNGEVIQTTDWEIEVRDGSLFGVKTTPNVVKLFGRILFKNDHVVFNGSYIDGADHYFRRAEVSRR